VALDLVLIRILPILCCELSSFHLAIATIRLKARATNKRQVLTSFLLVDQARLLLLQPVCLEAQQLVSQVACLVLRQLLQMEDFSDQTQQLRHLRLHRVVYLGVHLRNKLLEACLVRLLLRQVNLHREVYLVPLQHQRHNLRAEDCLEPRQQHHSLLQADSSVTRRRHNLPVEDCLETALQLLSLLRVVYLVLPQHHNQLQAVCSAALR